MSCILRVPDTSPAQRRLAVVNMSNIMRSIDSDVEQVTSIDAQLNSMESYINADVYHALRFKGSHLSMVGPANLHHFPKPANDEKCASDPTNTLGVALIQPVTAGIEFCRTKRSLFPTKRSLFVNIESVSTMLSFEDLNLIETVVTRLSSARSNRKLHDKANHETDFISLSLSESSDADRRELSFDPDLSTFNRVAATSLSKSYQVTFAAQRLGLGLKNKGGQIIVNSIQDTGHVDSIRIGDRLTSIGTFECFGCSLDEVVQQLSSSKRPITLTFSTRREYVSFPQENLREKTPSPVQEKENDTRKNREFLISSYTINFKKGVPTGLTLEPSCCGRFPVVIKVDPLHVNESAESIVDNFSNGLNETTLKHQCTRIPRIGAVIVAVNDVSIEDLGVDTTWSEIAKMVDQVSSQADPQRFFSLCFREIDSRLWGNVDSLDVSSSGFALSFIDDLNGRDMPLFRGKLEALEMHAERGLGGDSKIIEVQLSSILNFTPTTRGENGPKITLGDDEIVDLKSECVTTLSGIALCSVDYFHPRVACWEPLIEPSQLFWLLEMQSGSIISKRAGQVAVELSDRLLREQSFRANQLPYFGGSPQMVTVNLTDASIEVAMKSASQWNEWRKSVQSVPEDDDNEVYSQMDTELELRESNPMSDDTKQANTTTFPQVETRTRTYAKQAAKQRAAQAALIFAEKRGASSSKKVDSAKPFVLRNRTGVSIAFVQENCISSGNRVSSVTHPTRKDQAAVGEYAGLGNYDPACIHELGDKEDAKFSMEILSGKSDTTTTSLPSTVNKVRNYEGCFPSLTIAIQAVSGVSIDPLEDLQVYKVGSSVHHLTVRKDVHEEKSGNFDDIEYSIPVVWKVEIKDNRRVLTLSTAVRVVTTAFSTHMEIGVQRIPYHEQDKDVPQDISSIGIVRPDSPFYLPLWLALKLEAVNIFVRPQGDGAPRFDWGRSSILRFAPLLSIGENVRNCEGIGTWVWEENFEELDYVRCDSLFSGDAQPIWLAVFSGSSTNGAEQILRSKTKKPVSSMDFEEEHHEVISVTLDSNVTLRNLLPMSIDWQLAHVAYGSASPLIVDGSIIRSENSSKNEKMLAISSDVGNSLRSGECTEVFACDYQSSELQARFKELDGHNWSSWAPLSLDNLTAYDDQEDDDDDDDDDTNLLFPRVRQVNVQVTNDSFGVPLTFGVRVVPKVTMGTLDVPAKTRIYGIEIIVYAELWIRNITWLPLNFGCPSYQVHGYDDSSSETFDATATRFNAESALMEIANLLEVGDKGTGLNKKASRDLATTGGLESLPNQACDELWEEVFEYLEIEYSTVKRRWWASESYDSFRMNITQSNENGRWNWIDDNWVSGCRFLSIDLTVTGNPTSFSPCSQLTRQAKSTLHLEVGRVVEIYLLVLVPSLEVERSTLPIPFGVEGTFEIELDIECQYKVVPCLQQVNGSVCKDAYREVFRLFTSV